jgi:hypothetical protein
MLESESDGGNEVCSEGTRAPTGGDDTGRKFTKAEILPEVESDWCGDQ